MSFSSVVTGNSPHCSACELMTRHRDSDNFLSRKYPSFWSNYISLRKPSASNRYLNWLNFNYLHDPSIPLALWALGALSCPSMGLIDWPKQPGECCINFCYALLKITHQKQSRLNPLITSHVQRQFRLTEIISVHWISTGSNGSRTSPICLYGLLFLWCERNIMLLSKCLLICVVKNKWLNVR